MVAKFCDGIRERFHVFPHKIFLTNYSFFLVVMELILPKHTSWLAQGVLEHKHMILSFENSEFIQDNLSINVHLNTFWPSSMKRE